MRSRPMRHRQLPTIDLVLIAIDDGPECVLPRWKAAREDSFLQAGRMWLPVRAGQERSHRALNMGQAQNGFGIARRIAVPEAPEVFERYISLAVKECVLQAVGFIACETVRHIHHVTRLHPLILAHHGNKGIWLDFPRA